MGHKSYLSPAEIRWPRWNTVGWCTEQGVGFQAHAQNRSLLARWTPHHCHRIPLANESESVQGQYKDAADLASLGNAKEQTQQELSVLMVLGLKEHAMQTLARVLKHSRMRSFARAIFDWLRSSSVLSIVQAWGMIEMASFTTEWPLLSMLSQRDPH